ncbi:KilA-N domain-containing protein, partial [Candidatus Margulisiibacteriota bacterium]
SWMRNKDTIEFIGLWEQLHNPEFKPHEFVGFKNEAGTNRFNISPQKWTEATGAIGLISKAGRGGGTYAHEDIATNFGQWLSPEFSLYVVKEFKRLKQLEAKRLTKDWQLNRVLAKLNYRIHTDAVDKHLIPANTPNKLKWLWFTSEADLLNLALFGKTAKQWRDSNPDLEGNIRDYAAQEQLLVLANLETLNSQFIADGLSKDKRLGKLNSIAIEQTRSLLRYNITDMLPQSDPEDSQRLKE